MDIFFHSLFAGIQITLAILSLYIYMKKDTQKMYLYFGIFSFFSGVYFALISMSRIIEVDLYKAIITCAAIYYGIFSWFIYEFIERKTHVVLWILSVIFGIAWFLFVAEIGNGQVEIWQIVAHLGLIGLMAITVFASYRMKKMHQRGGNQLIILTILFIFLGLEEIFTSHTEYKILTNYISGILPLDFYPLLFSLVIGRQLSSDFYFKTKIEFERVKNSLIKYELNLQQLEQKRLEDELRHNRRDLTDFGIEITRRREYIENILEKLKDFKRMDSIQPSDINILIQYTRSQLQIGQNFNNFHKNVDKVNHEFTSKLKMNYPTMTDNDLHLASLLRLKLNTKEIAAVKNITPDSVKVLRYRLRKKFGLTANLNLTDFLSNY